MYDATATVIFGTCFDRCWQQWHHTRDAIQVHATYLLEQPLEAKRISNQARVQTVGTYLRRQVLCRQCRNSPDGSSGSSACGNTGVVAPLSSAEE
jgi:hypothetical protein